MVNTRVRMCEVKRERNEAHIHVPQRMLDYDTECSHNCKSNGEQFPKSWVRSPSNTAPSYYILGIVRYGV